MRQAGVTDAGVVLVQALTEVIDARWPSRQALLEALGDAAVKVGLDRKRLSKELGSGDKPKGPDWHVTELIVLGCIDDAAQRAVVLARMAGLYCAARQVERPPGYDKTITPALGMPGVLQADGEGHTALNAVITRLTRELEAKVSSLQELRPLSDGAFMKLAEQQQHLDRFRRMNHGLQQQLEEAQARVGVQAREIVALGTQVSTLAGQVVGRDAELSDLDRRYQDLVVKTAAQESEIGRLGQEAMTQSAQTFRVGAQLQRARRTIAVQQRGLHDTNARLAEHDLRAAAAVHRYRSVLEVCARNAAALESKVGSYPWRRGADNHRDNPHRGTSRLARRLQLDHSPQHRALAVYLLVHQEHSGRSVAQIAGLMSVSCMSVEYFLTATALPTPAQLAALVEAVGAEITHARLLYDDARPRLSPLATPPSTSRIDEQPVDSYESIVARLDGDTRPPTADSDTRELPIVAMSPGDNGDNRDTSATPVSPATRDTGDTTFIPARITAGDAAVYRSSRYQHRRRRHGWILRTVIASCALLVPLLLTTTTTAILHPADGYLVFVTGVAACLTCWAVAIGTQQLLRCRRRYHARHRNIPVQNPTAIGSATPAAPAVTLDTSAWALDALDTYAGDLDTVDMYAGDPDALRADLDALFPPLDILMVADRLAAETTIEIPVELPTAVPHPTLVAPRQRSGSDTDPDAGDLDRRPCLDAATGAPSPQLAPQEGPPGEPFDGVAF